MSSTSSEQSLDLRHIQNRQAKRMLLCFVVCSIAALPFYPLLTSPFRQLCLYKHDGLLPAHCIDLTVPALFLAVYIGFICGVWIDLALTLRDRAKHRAIEHADSIEQPFAIGEKLTAALASPFVLGFTIFIISARVL